MFLAKLASDMDKPDGLTVVPFDQQDIEQFLDPLPIDRIWGVGKVTQKKLLSLGLNTIGRLRQCEPITLQQAVGSRAAEVFRRLARGIDDRSIVIGSAEKSISNEITFKTDVMDRDVIESTCKKLIDKVGRRLRKAGYFATTAHLKIRWGDFTTITRQTRFPIPSADDITLREAGLALLQAHLRNRPVRLIGFGVSGLQESDEPENLQLNLFETADSRQHQKRTRLSQTADFIRHKYGEQSLKRGSDLD